MDGFEIQVGESGARQRRHRRFAGGFRVIEPVTESSHLRGNSERGRCFEVDLRPVQPARHHLHGLFVAAVSADGAQLRTSLHQPLMPLEQRRVVERIVPPPVEIGEHLGNPLLGWRGTPPITVQAELPTERRLNAVAVQDFSFDLGGLEGFRADQIDDQ
jgi:hypothetical protein